MFDLTLFKNNWQRLNVIQNLFLKDLDFNITIPYITKPELFMDLGPFYFRYLGEKKLSKVGVSCLPASLFSLPVMLTGADRSRTHIDESREAWLSGTEKHDITHAHTLNAEHSDAWRHLFEGHPSHKADLQTDRLLTWL